MSGRQPDHMTRIDPRIDLNLFRVLDAIHVHGGVSAAARALHLTQPAVTHALGRLRASLGDPLFVRHGNRLVPTAKAQAMLPAVRAHVGGLLACTHAQSVFDPALLQMVFSVSLREALESLVLPTLLARIGREAPQVRVTSHRLASNEAERALAAGTTHLVVDRPLPMGAAILRKTLGTDSLVVVMRQTHPLASGLSRAAYLAAEHVAVSAPGEASTLDLLLGQSGRVRAVRSICQHHLPAAQVAAQTDLLLTLPRSHAQQLANLLPLAIAELPMRLRAFPVVACWHRATDNDPAHAWLRDCIFDAMTVAGAITATVRERARR